MVSLGVGWGFALGGNGRRDTCCVFCLLFCITFICLNYAKGYDNAIINIYFFNLCAYNYF